LFDTLVMTTNSKLRTIRTTIPTVTYATIAYLAAEAGLTIGQFVQAALIDAVAGKRPALLDGVGVPPERDAAPVGDDGDIVEDLLG
jgi:hypothetical protein